MCQHIFAEKHLSRPILSILNQVDQLKWQNVCIARATLLAFVSCVQFCPHFLHESSDWEQGIAGWNIIYSASWTLAYQAYVPAAKSKELPAVQPTQAKDLVRPQSPTGKALRWCWKPEMNCCICEREIGVCVWVNDEDFLYKCSSPLHWVALYMALFCTSSNQSSWLL